MASCHSPLSLQYNPCDSAAHSSLLSRSSTLLFFFRFFLGLVQHSECSLGPAFCPQLPSHKDTCSFRLRYPLPFELGVSVASPTPRFYSSSIGPHSYYYSLTVHDISTYRPSCCDTEHYRHWTPSRAPCLAVKSYFDLFLLTVSDVRQTTHTALSSA